MFVITRQQQLNKKSINISKWYLGVKLLHEYFILGSFDEPKEE